ncbi:MAG: MBL fold metallo-hydrolase [Acetobacteraceae bacterium]|nr:MBL fold metallo-hydrolase [Acetobacteraceae bacterium]
MLAGGSRSFVWSSVTLVYGERDALLVDTFLTAEHSRELVDWIVASGKKLSTIYITHAHGDHFFGISILQDRFPDVRAVATSYVVKGMHRQIAPEYVASFWRARFPGQIPERLTIAEELENNQIDLERYKLVAVNIGHTDTTNTTCLHVPPIGLVVAGDAVYNQIHPYLAETNKQTRLEWLAALDKVESLNPRAVIAGHRVPDGDDDPKHIEETRQYIRDFIRLDEETATARELYDKMLELYPDRANPGSLWAAAHAAKTQVAGAQER